MHKSKKSSTNTKFAALAVFALTVFAGISRADDGKGLKVVVGLKHYCVLDTSLEQSDLSCFRWDGSVWEGAPDPQHATAVALFSQVYEKDSKNPGEFRWGDDDGCYLEEGRVHCWGPHGDDLNERFSEMKKAYLIAGAPIGVCIADHDLGLRCDDGDGMSYAGRPIFPGRARIEMGGESDTTFSVISSELHAVAIGGNKVAIVTKDGKMAARENGHWWYLKDGQYQEGADKADNYGPVQDFAISAAGRMEFTSWGRPPDSFKAPKGTVHGSAPIGKANCFLYADKVWCSEKSDEAKSFADLKNPAAIGGTIDRGCVLDWKEGMVCAYKDKKWQHEYLAPRTLKYVLPKMLHSLYRRKAKVIAESVRLLEEGKDQTDWQRPLFVMNVLSPLFDDVTTADFARRWKAIYFSRLARSNRNHHITGLNDFPHDAAFRADAGFLLQAAINQLDTSDGTQSPELNQSQVALGVWLAQVKSGSQPDPSLREALNKLSPLVEKRVAYPAARGLALTALGLIEYLKATE